MAVAGFCTAAFSEQRFLNKAADGDKVLTGEGKKAAQGSVWDGLLKSMYFLTPEHGG